MLTTSRKKMVGDQQREGHGPEAPHRTRAVDRGGLEHALRDAREAGEEKQEIVGDLLPGGGQDDQRRGLVAVEQRIPVDAGFAQIAREHAERGMQHEDPEHADHGRRDGVGPDQQRAIQRAAAHRLVRHDRQQQGHGERRDRDREREEEGPDDRLEIGGVTEEIEIIVEPDEAGRETEGVLEQEGLNDSLRSRPVEKDQDDRELRGNQRIGQQLRLENGLLLHDVS
ncbi:hypothetical protein ACVWW4_005386 [Bradyrhizobium sp. LB7.1]